MLDETVATALQWAGGRRQRQVKGCTSNCLTTILRYSGSSEEMQDDDCWRACTPHPETDARASSTVPLGDGGWQLRDASYVRA